MQAVSLLYHKDSIIKQMVPSKTWSFWMPTKCAARVILLAPAVEPRANVIDVCWLGMSLTEWRPWD